MAFDISKFAATLSPDVSDSDTMLREIPLDHLHPNARNFYPSLLPAEIDALTESIEANGLLEPLTVVPGDAPNDYRLISGHNRYRALSSLHERSPEDAKWQTVPCIVLPVLNQEQELSAIIEANRQRKKTGALLAEEAEKLTESYVARQKAGEKLPGRIRERVAEALRVSQTKLATVKAIKDHLAVPGFKERWEKGDIPEDAAYEISKLDQERQYRLLDWSIETHTPLTAKAVRMFVRETSKSSQPDKPQPPADSRLAYQGMGTTFGDERGETAPATPWKPLDRDHWPKEGTLVVLRGKTNLEGWIYQAAHCIGSPDDQYPFEDALDHLDLDANDELLDFSSWMTLIEEDDDAEA